MKGLIVEKSKIYYILLTPSGEYKKILGTTNKEVGEEADTHVIWSSSSVRLAALAAVLALIFLAQSIYAYFGPSRIYGYVTVDINPSAEFAINYDDNVLSARSFNDEGGYILAEVDYRGRKIDDVLADFTRQAIERKYINDDKQNRIVIAFVPKKEKDSITGAQKLEQIKEKEEQILQEAGENAEVETIILDMKTRNEAGSKGISSSKLDNEKKTVSTAADNGDGNNKSSSSKDNEHTADESPSEGNNKDTSNKDLHDRSNNKKKDKSPENEKEKDSKNTEHNNGKGSMGDNNSKNSNSFKKNNNSKKPGNIGSNTVPRNENNASNSNKSSKGNGNSKSNSRIKGNDGLNGRSDSGYNKGFEKRDDNKSRNNGNNQFSEDRKNRKDKTIKVNGPEKQNDFKGGNKANKSKSKPKFNSKFIMSHKPKKTGQCNMGGDKINLK